MSLLIMCLEFMKTGLFAIGGGLATIPFLYELADKYSWFTHQDILNYIAVAESTPGPIGINMSTFAGYSTHGILGAVLATFSLALPSVVVILIVAKILDIFRKNRFVEGAFKVLRPTSTALITVAGFNIFLVVAFNVEKVTFADFGRLSEVFTHVNWIAIGLAAVFFVLIRYVFKKVHVIFFILAGAAIGILLKL